MPEVIFRGKDYGGEQSSVTIPLGVTAVTGVNYDAFVTSIGVLEAAIQDLVYIPLHPQFKAIDEPADDQATDAEGQREKKWRVKYQSTVTGKTYSLELPGSILTGHLVAGTEFLNVAAGNGLAFVTAFEAEAREPGTDNSVTVLNVQFVGRSI